MAFNWGLLSEQSLANQPVEVRDELQRQATKQFLINTFLGGGLGAGYAAAQAVPEQYQAAVEQRAYERNLAQAKERASRPQGIGLTQTGEGSQFEMLQRQNEGFDQGQQQDVNAATAQALQSNRNIPRQLDVAEYARQIPAIIAQAGPRARLGNLEKVLQTALQVAPKQVDGAYSDPLTARFMGFAPKADIQTGIAFTGQRMEPIPGARSARARVALPTLAQGEQFVFDANNEPIGIMNMAGAVRALSERVSAQTAAQESEKVVPVTMPDNSIQYFRQADLVKRLGAGTQATANQPPAMPGTQPPGGFRTQSAYDVARQKTFEKAITKAQTDADMASSQNRTLDQLQVGIENFPTGAFANQKAALTSALSAFGVTGKRADQMLTGFSQTRTGLADFTANSIQDLSGATSDKDIVFSRQRFGEITDTKNALQFQIDMQRAINRRRIQKYQYLSENAGPDAETNWRKSSGGSSIFEEPELRKYLPTRQTRDGRTAYKTPTGDWVVLD